MSAAPAISPTSSIKRLVLLLIAASWRHGFARPHARLTERIGWETALTLTAGLAIVASLLWMSVRLSGIPDKRVGFPESINECRFPGPRLGATPHSGIRSLFNYWLPASSRELRTVAANSIPISDSPTYRSIL